MPATLQDNRQITRQAIDGVQLWDMEGLLDDLIALLCDLRDDHAGTTLRVAAEIDGEDSGIVIYHERPETDAERDQRLRQAERTEEWTRTHELRELARLKAKYEGGAA